MRIIKIFLLLCLFTATVSAQTFTQRLNPDVTSTEAEICPNDEVEITLSYNVPNNTSVLFNGLDENINIPANPAFDFGAATNFTIECFIKSSSNSIQTIVSKGTLTSPGFVIGLLAGNVFVTISDGNSAPVTISGFTPIADGAWHHVAVVFERTANATIYIDGFFDNDAAINAVGSVTNTELLLVGAFNTGAGLQNYLNGYIDELRIWDVAKTVAQINAAGNSHINPNSVSNLIGYWDMNDLSGTSVIDCSTSGASGVLVNSASFSADAPSLTWNFNPIWSTGQAGTTTIFANPLDTTTYSVSIGYCKYLSTDSVTVNVVECEVIDETGLISSVWVANSFTPNGDYKNDVFLVQASNITYYEIMIFNRFGNILYHSKNILNSWDGTFNDNRVEDDVYTYVITYRDRFDEQHKKYGTVTVLH